MINIEALEQCSTKELKLIANTSFIFGAQTDPLMLVPSITTAFMDHEIENARTFNPTAYWHLLHMCADYILRSTKKSALGHLKIDSSRNLSGETLRQTCGNNYEEIETSLKNEIDFAGVGDLHEIPSLSALQRKILVALIYKEDRDDSDRSYSERLANLTTAFFNDAVTLHANAAWQIMIREGSTMFWMMDFPIHKIYSAPCNLERPVIAASIALKDGDPLSELLPAGEDRNAITYKTLELMGGKYPIFVDTSTQKATTRLLNSAASNIIKAIAGQHALPKGSTPKNGYERQHEKAKAIIIRNLDMFDVMSQNTGGVAP